MKNFSQEDERICLMKYWLSQFILDSQASFNSYELTNGHHSKWISTLIFKFLSEWY